jgi:hypothetical protein
VKQQLRKHGRRRRGLVDEDEIDGLDFIGQVEVRNDWREEAGKVADEG